jgi:ribosomal protein S27AE
MTGAVTVAAIVGLLSLLAGVALGWYLRRTNDWCPSCGDQLACEGCGAGATWAKHQATPAGRS